VCTGDSMSSVKAYLRQRSLGLLILKALTLSPARGVLALFAFALQGQVPAVLGVWDLDLSRSNLPAQVFPAGIQSETRSYAMRTDGYLVVLALRVNGNGTLDFIQV